MSQIKALLPKFGVFASALIISALGHTADETQQREPEKKTTIDTFPLQQLEQEALSKAVIEGGLEPPAAGDEVSSEQNATPRTQPGAKVQTELNNPNVNDTVRNPNYNVRFNYRYPRYQNQGSSLLDRYDRVYTD